MLDWGKRFLDPQGGNAIREGRGRVCVYENLLVLKPKIPMGGVVLGHLLSVSGD